MTEETDKTLHTRIAIGMFFGLVAAIAIYHWTKPSGFTDDIVAMVKREIREGYEKRGAEVKEVVMARQDRRKLIGYVTINVPIFGERQIPCEANMTQDEGYIWNCRT